MADLCEWDPTAGRAAREVRTTDAVLRLGCTSRIEVVVGSAGQWRLCRSCAALPMFRRYRVRREVKRHG